MDRKQYDVSKIVKDSEQALTEKKYLEKLFQHLAGNEQFFKEILDAAPCLLCCLDCNGNFLYMNQRYAEFRGIHHEKMIGHHFSEVILPKFHKKRAEVFAKCLQGETVKTQNQDRLKKAKKDSWLHGIYMPILLKNQKVEKILVAMMDVTEQEEMQRQLNEAEKFGRTGSWKINLATKQFTCSDGILDLYEMSREEVDKYSYEALFLRLADIDIARITAQFRLIFKKRHSVSEELWIHLPQGTRRLVKVTGYMLKNAEGRPIEIFGRIDDITQQKALEKAEQDVTLRLREFSRAMPGVGMIVDAMGKVVEIFDDSKLLTDADSVSWERQKITTLLPSKVAEKFSREISIAIAKNMVRFGEYTLPLLRGERIFDVRIAPLRYRLEEHATVACYWADVTEKNHTKKLLKSNYEKRRQRDLLNDLATGKIEPSQEVLDQAWQVKLNLTFDFSCYLIGFQKNLKYNKRDILNEKQDTLQVMIDLLIEKLSGDTGTIVWESKDGIVMLVPVDENKVMKKEQELIQAEKWSMLIGQCVPELEYCIGIAEFRPETFWKFAEVYAEACAAVEFGEKMADKQRVHHYLDIGVFQFFPAVINQEYVNSFVNRMLGKLEEYDRINGTDLVYTLERILQIDNLNMVAKELYVHRQTILFRKRRIETILNVSLNDFEARLALGMAFKFKQAYGKNT
jgi:PAS domain S-box-containing protein